MQSSTKKALGPSWQDAVITRITGHAPTGGLSWLYPLYEWVIYLQSNIRSEYVGSSLKICPRVPDDITDPMVPISSSYIGLFQAKHLKRWEPNTQVAASPTPSPPHSDIQRWQMTFSTDMNV